MIAVKRLDSPMHETSDAQLMLRVQHDEPTAFARLMGRHHRQVFLWFYRLLHHYQDAEDLTQQTFLQAFRARKRYQPTAKFSTWLFTIVNNLARSYMRKRRRAVRLSSLYDVPDRGMPASPVNEDPLVIQLRKEQRQHLLDVIDDLPSRQRDVLSQFVLDEHPYAVIADNLNLSLSATKSLLHRARSTLRKHLIDDLRIPA